MALARLTGVKPTVQDGRAYRVASRFMKDMPVEPNEPRNWELADEYTGVQAFDLFNIGPVLGMDWNLTNLTTDVVAVVVDDDNTYYVVANQIKGCANKKFIRMVVTPEDLAGTYYLEITGIKP